MCGLFGAWGWSQQLNTAATLEALKSRGPDDHGEFHDPCGLTLLHTRLAIQDLSTLGHQPMQQAIKAWCWCSTVRSTTNCNSAANWKPPATTSARTAIPKFCSMASATGGKISGIAWRHFAVACWEPHDKRLTLARDRFGVKPLLWQREPQRLAFASELSALIASGCCNKEALNPKAIESYLLWGSVAAPNTIVDGVQVFPAGHWASCQLGQSWQLQRFRP